MDALLRATATYLFIFLVIRISGRRTLGEMGAFDFVLLLIISEATQQALLDGDNSITNSWTVVGTLIGLDIVFTLAKRKWPALSKMMDGVPTILMRDGRLLKDRMWKARVSEDDILSAAREQHGIGSLKEIEHVVLEKNGALSVLPR